MFVFDIVFHLSYLVLLYLSHSLFPLSLLSLPPLSVLSLSSSSSYYRDLKPENLVFCQSSNDTACIKLTDFGLSRTFMPGEMIESSCGSLEYSAPEILLGDSYDPPKVGELVLLVVTVDKLRLTSVELVNIQWRSLNLLTSYLYNNDIKNEYS